MVAAGQARICIALQGSRVDLNNYLQKALFNHIITEWFLIYLDAFISFSLCYVLHVDCVCQNESCTIRESS